MTYRKILNVGVLLFFVYSFSQTKTCEKSSDDLMLDLNSITKCSIQKEDKHNGEVKKVAVRVTSRRRIVRKRDAATGIVTNDYSHKIADMKKKTSALNELTLESNTGMKMIPFSFVDEIPLFASCQSAPIHLQEKCFRKELSNHIRKNLRYPESAYHKGIQGRVFAYFNIDKQGNISDINITSPYKGEDLGKEAKRIVKKLPKLMPGKQNGVPVNVKYGLPITFKIPGVKRTNIREKTENRIIKEQIYTLNKLDKLPQFKACSKAKDTSLKCFNTSLIKHIQNNFAYPVAAINNKIEGSVTVSFIISDDGEVLNISAKGPENTEVLESAAKQLVEKLPKFKAAEKNGKSVHVAYSFPIDFSLDQ